MFSLHWALLNPAKGALMNTCGWLLSCNISFIPPIPPSGCYPRGLLWFLPVCNRNSRTHTHTLSCCEELIVWYSVTDLNHSIWYFLQRICASGGGFWFSYVGIKEHSSKLLTNTATSGVSLHQKSLKTKIHWPGEQTSFAQALYFLLVTFWMA